MVPDLIFANAVLCLKSHVLLRLEVNQRMVGRSALSAHSITTNEALPGDMGWASFEVQEAQNKMRFEEGVLSNITSTKTGERSWPRIQMFEK